jgi:hypothetical protein
MKTTFQEIKFWLEYRLHKDKTFVADGFTDEPSMRTELKKLIKSGYKPKIVDLSKSQKQQLATI